MRELIVGSRQSGILLNSVSVVDDRFAILASGETGITIGEIMVGISGTSSKQEQDPSQTKKPSHESGSQFGMYDPICGCQAAS